MSSNKKEEDTPVADIALKSEVWAASMESGDAWEIGHLVEKRTYKNQPSEWVIQLPGENELRTCKPRDVHLTNPPEQDGIDDMANLLHLHEPGLLHNVLHRYKKGIIYTYTGPILIALNPYQFFRNLYTVDLMKKYRNQELGKLPPHVYAIAEDAFQCLQRNHSDQSILVSGESGAGKTETTKIILDFLVNMSTHFGGGASASSDGRADIGQRIVQSSPILEAFGNAKTLFNDNSSRFGKFVQVRFDERYRIVGAGIRTYLLERSRITRVQKGERSYHIFYDLFKLPDDVKDKLQLTDIEQFQYLNQSDCFEIAGESDAQHLQRVLKACAVCGIAPEEQSFIWRVLAAVLHLGNVQFVSSTGAAEGPAKLRDPTAVQRVASLLEVPPLDLESALLRKKIKAGSTEMVVALTTEKAEFGRDTLAMSLYSRLFTHIVQRVNQQLEMFPASAGAPPPADCEPRSFIGILDIYGFEVFERNSFEQLCINYANEKLQSLFNELVLHYEQLEFIKEGLQWTPVDYVDNKECLEVIERRPDGLLAILDEECMFPKATEKSLMDKLVAHLGKSKFFEKARFGHSEFVIRHYAARVTYHLQGFLEKNSDFVVAEHQQVMDKSKMSLVLKLFAQASMAPISPRGGSTSPRRSPSPRSPRSSTEPLAQLSPQRRGSEIKSSFAFQSVAAQFRESLGQLISTIEATQSHYIRCIKPNAVKQPMTADPAAVQHQIRCSGLVEATRITAMGLPTRMPYDNFIDRYGLLKHGGVPAGSDARLMSKQLLQQLGLNADRFRLGRTKVFFRAGVSAELDGLRLQRIAAAAVKIQSRWRAFVARRNFAKYRSLLVKLQARWRGVAARKRYIRTRKVLVRLQARWKGVHARKEFVRLKEEARLAAEAKAAREARAAEEARLAAIKAKAEQAEKKQKELEEACAQAAAEAAQAKVDEEVRLRRETERRQAEILAKPIVLTMSRHRRAPQPHTDAAQTSNETADTISTESSALPSISPPSSLHRRSSTTANIKRPIFVVAKPPPPLDLRPPAPPVIRDDKADRKAKENEERSNRIKRNDELQHRKHEEKQIELKEDVNSYSLTRDDSSEAKRLSDALHSLAGTGEELIATLRKHSSDVAPTEKREQALLLAYAAASLVAADPIASQPEHGPGNALVSRLVLTLEGRFGNTQETAVKTLVSQMLLALEDRATSSGKLQQREEKLKEQNGLDVYMKLFFIPFLLFELGVLICLWMIIRKI